MPTKRKHSETSKEAQLLKTDESKMKDYAKIEKALQVIGNGTYEEIANQMTVKDLNIVSRRLLEMVGMDKIRKTDIKRKTSRNRNAFVYTLCTSTSIKTDKQLKEATKTIKAMDSIVPSPKFKQPELFQQVN